ncbi:MAG: DNA polymerase III subunit beta [Chloroflexi bacterium]|nr:DNA polymerase III subunit beta [Chloroflexota bacterium]
MKLSCLQENLSRGLSIVGRAVATRTTLPITQNVLLSTDEGRLKLAATNLEIAIVTWVGAQVEEEGAITIPAKLLADFVGSLPADKVEMTLPAGSKVMELRCARFQARITGSDADDFPPIPRLGEGVTTAVAADEFRQAVTQVTLAAATEDVRPVLTGVQCEFEGDTLTMASADGFRLAMRTLSLAQPVAEKVSAIIPAKTLNELGRLAADQQDPIQITLSPQKGQVLFKLKSVEMVSQLVQGTFPNYRQLIPQSHTNKAVVPVAEFMRATRMASIFARDGSGIVRLVINPGEGVAAGKMVVSARADEVGDNVGELDAKVEGQPSKIAFNSKYLTDVLGVVKQAEVTLETTTPSSPGVLRPIGDDSFVYVVMPMFVQW